MLDREEICWPSTCELLLLFVFSLLTWVVCGYFLVAIAQIALVLVAAAHHAKVREGVD